MSSIRWSVLIGSLTGALSALHLARVAVNRVYILQPAFGYVDAVITGIGVVGLILCYPIMRGQNGARLTLVGLVSLFALLFIVRIPLAFIVQDWEYGLLMDLLWGLSCLCMMVFAIILLMRPDVRRDFHRSREAPPDI